MTARVRPPTRRDRLAIVSTSNQLCGIAAYTAALERQLAALFDLTVFDLDQYLLRSAHPRVRRAGDAHIDAICRELGAYDAVNLQVEYGTLGRRTGDIRRRLARLLDAAPRVSVTLHTVKPLPPSPRRAIAKAMLGGRPAEAASAWVGHRRDRQLSAGIAELLRRAQRRKPTSVIVHTRRDAREARHLHGFDNVFDHPLSFLSADQAAAVRGAAARGRFPQLDRLPADAVLVGVFGFLDAYKGFGTAVRALRHLPERYHLLVFGGTHPNEIPVHQPIHPYVASLLDDAYVDLTPYDRLVAAGGTVPSLSIGSDHWLAELLGPHPRDLSRRLHFMGALGDADFLAGMAVCDATVFPYLEVGQSSSGPISQALELGCRIIASRTRAFLEFADYHPHAVEFFDIGNHLELAERIASRPQHPARPGPPRFNTETNRAVYLAANGVEASPSQGSAADPSDEARRTPTS